MLEDGESAASVADELGIPHGTFRSWIHRYKSQSPPVARIVPNPEPVDLSALSPIELLEHDIAEARADLQDARTAAYFNVLPTMRAQIGKMTERLQAARNAIVEEKTDTDAEVWAAFSRLTRTKKWVRRQRDDPQSRRIIDAVLAE